MMQPEVDSALRGNFSALAAPAVIDYLVDLGVTAVELLPVHAAAPERMLTQRRLTNYWGYSTIGFFAPDPRFMPMGAIAEFKSMVQRLHDAGLEVILDVVYNHTGEGNHLGPTLSFRGIDNLSYYRLQDDRRYYQDVTGTGNTLNLDHPRVLQLVTDSLRYWARDMHVDGFRFDLAPTLAREGGTYSQGSAFFDTIRQDPELAGVKLIAEPWDVGPGGYQLGNFPPGWAEWNGQYRDVVRRFWKGDSGLVADVASRVAGSSDIFGYRGRRPWASVNFLTAHDGFTLHDLVSYNGKHNEANGEDNRDGHDANFQLELRCRRTRRRPGDQWLARPTKAQPSGSCCCRWGCRCWSPAMRWGAPSAATTTLIARTRDLVDRLAARTARGCGIRTLCASFFIYVAATGCSRARAFFAARCCRRTGSRTSPG